MGWPSAAKLKTHYKKLVEKKANLGKHSKIS